MAFHNIESSCQENCMSLHPDFEFSYFFQIWHMPLFLAWSRRNPEEGHELKVSLCQNKIKQSKSLFAW